MSNAVQIAETILSQLGGSGRLQLMCGCKNFMALGPDEQGVRFKVGKNEKRVTLCQVVLDPSDTYTVKFYTGSALKLRVVKELSGVYADQLREIFEQQTAMYLTF